MLMLSIASGNGRLKCLQWLLDHGADGRVCKREEAKLHTVSFAVSLRNSLGETPIDVARKYGKTECIALLGGIKNKNIRAAEDYLFTGGTGLDTEEEMKQSPETLGKQKIKPSFILCRESTGGN